MLARSSESSLSDSEVEGAANVRVGENRGVWVVKECCSLLSFRSDTEKGLDGE